MTQHQNRKTSTGPSSAWIEAAFSATVKLNEKSHEKTIIGSKPIIEDTKRMDFFESQMRISPAQIKKSDAPLAHRILEILLNGRFRKGNLENINPYVSKFLSKINLAIQSNRPIEIVLPSLPFKNANLLSCGTRLGATDLGEWLFFAQMRDLIISVAAIHEPGCTIIVLCDGLVYADIFANNDTAGAIMFRNNCEQIKNRLGMENSIRLVDMSDVCHSIATFEFDREQIEHGLKKLAKRTTLFKHFQSLRRGMLFNLPFRGVSWDMLANCAQCEEYMWPKEIAIQTEQAALRFASFLLTLKHHDAIANAFPNAIRATVHPKKAAQLPLHLVNNGTLVFPYNGLPVVSASKLEQRQCLRRAATIMRRCDLSRFVSISEVVIEAGGDPFFLLVP